MRIDLFYRKLRGILLDAAGEAASYEAKEIIGSVLCLRESEMTTIPFSGREMSEEELASRLNNALPPEMRVIDAYSPDTKFTAIKYAEYEILTDEEFDIAPLEKDAITVMKRSKSGTKETDIKPLIFSFEKIDGGIKCVLSADNAEYLNPEYIATVLGLCDYSITRKRVLLSDGITEFR